MGIPAPREPGPHSDAPISMTTEFEALPRAPGDAQRETTSGSVDQTREEQRQREERERADRIGKLERERADQEGRRARGV